MMDDMEWRKLVTQKAEDQAMQWLAQYESPTPEQYAMASCANWGFRGGALWAKKFLEEPDVIVGQCPQCRWATVDYSGVCQHCGWNKP